MFLLVAVSIFMPYLHFDVLKSKKNVDLYDIFTLQSVYEPLIVRSFECEIKISIINDKTKQLLCLIKWQALVVNGQDNYKMDVIVQCRIYFL